jgi:hypothetical protein
MRFAVVARFCRATGSGLTIRRKAGSISLDLRFDAAAVDIFKTPAEQEVDDALACDVQGPRLVTR